MKQRIPTMALGVFGAFLVAAGPVCGASTALLIDWLELGTGDALLDDGGATAANVALGIDSGALFPGNPQAVSRGGAYWKEAVPYVDTQTGNGALNGMSLRVAPMGGSARYTVDLAVPGPADLVLSIGQLFHDAQSATDAVEVSAILGGGGGSPVVSYLGAFEWDDGLVAFEDDLTWDSGTGVLGFAGPGDGESKVAFFRLRADGTNVTGFRVTVGSGYAVGAGDSIDVGLGIVIPEPSVPVLAGLAALGLLARRRS